MTLPIVLMLLTLHFIADFLLQDDTMAINKSSSNWWLSIHVLVYMTPFVFIGSLSFWVTNYALHWATDYISSRVSKTLWEKEQRHWFFVVIGFDQLLHMSALFTTYWYLVL